MNANDTFDRRLAAWLDSDAQGRLPDHLAEVLVATRASRQRPWWSSPERWLPVDLTFKAVPFALGRTGRLAILLVLLLIAAVTVITFIGTQQSRPIFGLADNGQIVVTDGTTLRTLNPDGSVLAQVATLPGPASSIVVSPDGRRVAYVIDVGGRSAVRVTTIAGGTTVDVQAPQLVGGEPIGWSPDGRWLTFAGLEAGVEHVYIAAADGTSLRTVADDGIDDSFGISSPTWSPDGAWLAFVAGADLEAGGRMYLVRPDGTDFRVLDPREVVVGDGGWISWAPDPAVHRLLYAVHEFDGLHVRLYDVASGQDYQTGLEFWPSWSPDGNHIAGCCARIVATADVMAGAPQATRVFEELEGNCDAFLDRTGFAICSTATWSPDGTKLIAVDVAGGALLIAPVDGSTPPMKVDLAAGAGAGYSWAWQPIRR